MNNKYQEALKRLKLFFGNSPYTKELTILQELIDKESKYQALEEELGISLPILFKALKNGVQGYKSIESLYYEETNETWYIECIYKYGDYGTHYTDALALKDYGKTWYLKEDLKERFVDITQEEYELLKEVLQDE